METREELLWKQVEDLKSMSAFMEGTILKEQKGFVLIWIDHKQVGSSVIVNIDRLQLFSLTAQIKETIREMKNQDEQR